MIPKQKPRVGIFNLSSCEGCIVQILNLGEKLLDLLKLFSIVDCRVLGVKEDYNKLDIAIIEGCVMSFEEEVKAREIRERSEIVIALGDCAVSGNINFMKDITNTPHKSKPLSEVIKVDHEIPGCPISSEEFYRALIDILMGKKITEKSITVCSECVLRENNCLLEKGVPCLGPITRGGCNAICPSNNRPCFGCRGLADDANIDALIKAFRDRNIPISQYLIALNQMKHKGGEER